MADRASHWKPHVHFSRYHSQMNLVCNRRASGLRPNSGRHAGGNVLFAASRRAWRKHNSYFPVSISLHLRRALRDLIECESNRWAVTTRNRVMQHCMQSGLWAGEIPAPAALRQEKQPEKSRSNLEASLYLNTHLDSGARRHVPQQRLPGASSNPASRHCPSTESFKGGTRTSAVYLPASWTSCLGRT